MVGRGPQVDSQAAPRSPVEMRGLVTFLGNLV